MEWLTDHIFVFLVVDEKQIFSSTEKTVNVIHVVIVQNRFSSSAAEPHHLHKKHKET